MPKIAIVIAFNGFRDEEFFVPYEEFNKVGIESTIYSWDVGTAVGKYGGTTPVNHKISEIKPTEIDAIVLIGGPGGYKYIGDQILMSKINEVAGQGKLVAAICMAPQLVAETGLLMGKRATIFPPDKDKLIGFGAIYTAATVEIDGNFITADGASSSKQFADKIIETLGV